MSLSDAFHPNNVEVVPARASKRPPPFSLRLTEAERATLIAQANGVPLGAYVKARLFEGDPIQVRGRAPSIQHDRQALAQALALLGQSDLARNIAALARAAEIGALPVDPDTEAMLRSIRDDVREIRALVMRALGLRLEDAP